MRAYSTIQDAMSLGTGVERQFHCGNPDHEDRNASASVNSITGAFLCYSCGWKGKIDVDNYEIEISMVGRQLDKLSRALEEPERELTESWLSMFDAAGPGEYWLSRFSEAVCRDFRLGVDYVTESATIPLRDAKGRPLGVIRRSLGRGPKYLYPPDVDISDYLFAYERCDDDIIVLVEGATDAIASWEVGHQAMAIYGSRMSKAQEKLIDRYDPKALILAFDMDEAGDRAAREVTARYPYIEVTRPEWRDREYKDLASMPLDLRKEVLNLSRTIIVNRLAQPRSNVLTYESWVAEKIQSSRPSESGGTPSSKPRKLRIVRDTPKESS